VPETGALLGAVRGTTWLMAALIYWGGLRVIECCQLRVKDVDFDQGLLVVRSRKGDKDRTTLLADRCREPLRAQLCTAEAIHQKDRAGLGRLAPGRARSQVPARRTRARVVLGISQAHALDRSPQRHRRHHISRTLGVESVTISRQG